MKRPAAVPNRSTSQQDKVTENIRGLKAHRYRCGWGQPRSGFTLIELLVVITIIAVFIALLLPAVSRPRDRPVSRVRLEIAHITRATYDYEAVYDCLPVATASNIVATGNSDLTYAGRGLSSFFESQARMANNSEIMAVLLDLEQFGNGSDTVNKGHRLNPQRTRFLSATMVSDAKSPGLGSDGVYRDPWGSPYIISLDMNNDGKCFDALYRLRAVSQWHGSDGFNGLTNSRDSGGAGDNFAFNGKVMVWSLGPDKSANANQAANAGVNRDNILSWRE